VVVLTTPGHWVIGALANNQWSYAGWGKSNVDALLIQPFTNYNFPDGWYVTSSPIITANWLAASNNRWTLPIGGGVGKIVKFGKLPVRPRTNLLRRRQRQRTHTSSKLPWIT